MFSALTSLLLSLPLTAAADSCQDVVEDTVDEIKAGASASWTADTESLVRAAAGSACVKALSERYSSSVVGASAVSSDAVGASSEAVLANEDKKSAASGEAASKDDAE